MKNTLLALIAICCIFTAHAQLQQSNNTRTQTSSATFSKINVLPEAFNQKIERPILDTTAYRKIITPPLFEVMQDLNGAEQNFRNNQTAKREVDALITRLTAEEQLLQSTSDMAARALESARLRLATRDPSLENLETIRLREQLSVQTEIAEQYATNLNRVRAALATARTNSAQLQRNITAAQNEISRLETRRTALEQNLTDLATSYSALKKKSDEQTMLLYKYDLKRVQDYFNSTTRFVKELERELHIRDSLANVEEWKFDDYDADTNTSSLLGLYRKLLNSLHAAQTHVARFAEVLPELERKVNSFADNEKYQRYENAVSDKLTQLITSQLDSIDKTITAVTLAKTKLEEQFLGDKTNFDDAHNKIQNKLKTKKKQNNDAALLADFTQPINQASGLIPGIKVFAQNKFNDNENSSIYGQVYLFLAPGGNDTNTLTHTTRLFIPEASQFGFVADFNFGFIPATATTQRDKNTNRTFKRMGINLSFSYLQKQLAAKEKEKPLLPIGMIQTRAGMEFILIKNILCVYANLQGIMVGKGIENYAKYYDDANRMRWYVDTGLKSYLKLSGDESLNLLLDLRFIPVNPTVKMLTETKDKFIPLFKLGIVKSFDF